MTTLKLNSKSKKVLLTQKGEVSKKIINALLNCNFDSWENKIYTGYYIGSGRFTSRQSAQGTVLSILKAKGYKYTTGNDSLRGGASGEFVKVSSVAFGFLLNISKQ